MRRECAQIRSPTRRWRKNRHPPSNCKHRPCVKIQTKLHQKGWKVKGKSSDGSNWELKWCERVKYSHLSTSGAVYRGVPASDILKALVFGSPSAGQKRANPRSKILTSPRTGDWAGMFELQKHQIPMKNWPMANSFELTVESNVTWFQVAVHDAVGMEIFQASCDLESCQE